MKKSLISILEALKRSPKYMNFGLKSILKERLILTGLFIIIFSPLLGYWEKEIQLKENSRKTNPFVYTLY